MMAAFHRPRQTILTACIFVITLHTLVMGSNRYFSFQPCPPQIQDFTVDGASLMSQTDRYYNKLDFSCTLNFQTSQPYQTFLLQFTKLNIRKGSSTCPDYLTIYGRNSVPLLDKYCGALSGLNSPVMYTNSSSVQISWTTSSQILDSGSSQYTGFLITLTAITQPPVICDSKVNIQCYNGDCIRNTLKCDGVRHCSGRGEDELRCTPVQQGQAGSETVTSLYPPTTTQLLGTTGKPKDEQDIYLWLPLLVVVLFTGLMIFLITIGRKQSQTSADFAQLQGPTNSRDSRDTVGTGTLPTSNGSRLDKLTNIFASPTQQLRPTATTPQGGSGSDSSAQPDLISVVVVICVFVVGLSVCVFVGCRSKEQHRQEPSTSHEIQGLTDPSNNNTQPVSNSAPTDGRPATPPPTYSMIERQTSYVSYISQSSSQICEPPDYDEAVDMPGENGERGHATRHVGRSVSQQRPPNSFRTRIRDRLLNRSRSVQEHKPHRYKPRSESSSTDADGGNISSDHEGGVSDISTSEVGSVAMELSGVSSPGSGPHTSTPERLEASETRTALLRNISNLINADREHESESRPDPLPNIAIEEEPDASSSTQAQRPTNYASRSEARNSEPHYVNIDMQNK